MSEQPKSEIALTSDQEAFNPKQVAVLQQLGMQGASQPDLAVFFHQCQRTGLDPFAKQIYMISRQGKQTIQTGIDGFRLIARRSTDRTGGTLGEVEDVVCGEDGVWRDVLPPGKKPFAARYTIERNGGRFSGIAHFEEYAGRKRDGNLNQMWATKPMVMLRKCAEALALRKAFPQDLSGLYTAEEMSQADQEAAPPSTPPVMSSQEEAAHRAKSDPGLPNAKRMEVAHWVTQAGITKGDAIAWISEYLGREIKFSSELTHAEADEIITFLQSKVKADSEVLEGEVVDAAT